MSYTEYLRRKEAAAPKVIDTTLRLDASSYTERVKFASSRVLNEVNLRTTEQVDVLNTVSTLAGSAVSGNVDGIGSAARFNNLRAICIDPTQLNLYVLVVNAIRKIEIATANVTLLAGSTDLSSGNIDGIGTIARFNTPEGLIIDPLGNNLYIADSSNNTIRKVVIATGEVTTFAGSGTAATLDGTGLAAQFNNPRAITIDPLGNNLYVLQPTTVRRIVISSAEVTTLSGTYISAYGITIDPAGLNLYITDSAATSIKRFVLSNSQLTTIAGSQGFSGYLDDIGTNARFRYPTGISIDSVGLNLYVTDENDGRIRKISLLNNQVTTVAGDGSNNSFLDGSPLIAKFQYPTDCVIDSQGLNIYVTDRSNNRIRKIGFAYTYFQTNIPINKAKSGGRIADASVFTQYTGGQAVGKEVQAGMPPRRLLLNSNSAGSLTGCRIVPEPVPYNPAVGGVYSANMVRRDASQFTRDETACRQLTGEPHNANELGPSLFVDNTIVGVKNYNLPQNNSKTYIATKCTQCGNNGSQLAKTCSFCIGANHLHPADKPTNNRWGPRPKKSAQPIIVNQSPSDFHKVGAAMRKIPYVEKHHANPQIGHIVYPKTPYRIPRGTAAQLKINDPQRYPGTM